MVTKIFDRISPKSKTQFDENNNSNDVIQSKERKFLKYV